MDDEYMYGGKPARVESAAGVKSILCRTLDGTMIFRVYDERHQFTDYELTHDDLCVTIGADELAALYKDGEQHVLDHSPEVLRLRVTVRNDDVR